MEIVLIIPNLKINVLRVSNTTHCSIIIIHYATLLTFPVTEVLERK